MSADRTVSRSVIGHHCKSLGVVGGPPGAGTRLWSVARQHLRGVGSTRSGALPVTVRRTCRRPCRLDRSSVWPSIRKPVRVAVPPVPPSTPRPCHLPKLQLCACSMILFPLHPPTPAHCPSRSLVQVGPCSSLLPRLARARGTSSTPSRVSCEQALFTHKPPPPYRGLTAGPAAPPGWPPGLEVRFPRWCQTAER